MYAKDKKVVHYSTNNFFLIILTYGQAHDVLSVIFKFLNKIFLYEFIIKTNNN